MVIWRLSIDVAGFHGPYATSISHASINTVCDISQCSKRILMPRRATVDRVKAFAGLGFRPEHVAEITLDRGKIPTTF
jgi:hypothetical protein